MGINIKATHLDDRWHWERHGIDPDEHIAAFRRTCDEEAVKRGLFFVGEVRLGQEIQRQYLVPTWWLRLKRVLGLWGRIWPKELKPRQPDGFR